MRSQTVSSRRPRLAGWLSLDAQAGIEPAFYRFAGDDIASLPPGVGGSAENRTLDWLITSSRVQTGVLVHAGPLP